ncbi:ABC transporter ATP-binding protein [Lactobacillus sp. DCY120]|uniref:ABC transporter ATP-binding protein n=1 Tax=Bombilactobacillus apium TaxID=2675299 RepID=A0A850QY45_9LACO|nr:ABC transporter ATP-binding protein [Bombilactobacillus apium]NVY95629.1 ABC transporter ATP-binding protein [Bombilactobacillus apium]
MTQKKKTKQAQFAPQRAQNFWGTTWRLFRYLSGYNLVLALVLILAVAATIFQIKIPKVLGEATTEIYRGVIQGLAQQKVGQHLSQLPINFSKIGQILLLVIGLYLLSAGFNLIQQLLMTRASQRSVFKLRRDLKAKLQRLPISYYDTHDNGDLMSRAINDMDNIASTLQQSLTQLVTSLVTFVGTLWMMFTISWQLALVALVTVPLSMVVVGLVAPKSQRAFAAQQKSLGSLNSRVEENYAGHLVLKSFNREPAALQEFNEENNRLYHSAWKAQLLAGILMPLMTFVNNLGYVAVALFGGLQVAQGSLPIGDIQAFLQYVQQFSQPITQLANLANTIQATVASAERIFQVLDEPELEPDLPATEAKADASLVEFDQVKFAYTPDRPLLTNYSLKVAQGEMVAIVGPTGAGKTTIINLLERFYEVQAGAIYLRGQDTRSMSREQLRSHLAMVLQETWLFTGTIYENLQYGNEAATKAEIMQAAKAAHVDEFVRQLPQGYETVLNEEASNISQGQRQLLTIARAFVADPEILILDEATSSVDTRTELQIQHAMQLLLRGRTSFVVAHRLSTIQDADQIIVMNHGKIIETGQHKSLLARQGFYAHLYNSQFSGQIN